jgi:hypothetical protein
MPFGVMVSYPGYLAAVFLHDNRIISALIARASTRNMTAARTTRGAQRKSTERTRSMKPVLHRGQAGGRR